MKKILFVINTLGTGGAEVSLLELLKKSDTSNNEVSLFVLLNQGELVEALPEGIKLLNKKLDYSEVHSPKGLWRIKLYSLGILFRKFSFFRFLPYTAGNLLSAKKDKRRSFEKIMWYPIALSTPALKEHYDMAVSYIEGGATHFVSRMVSADIKVAFVHTDYSKAGYSRKLDMNSYAAFDRIFAVSDEAKDSFLSVYPELSSKTETVGNTVNISSIKEKAEVPGGFDDGYDGIRILSIGRLRSEKAFEISVDAMRILKDEGIKARWYVLGEGDRRKELKARIERLGLENDFYLLGNRSNPYPYLRQCDIYVQTSRYEGKSMAIQEAKVLQCPLVVTDCGGNREQIIDGEDGFLCAADPAELAEKVKLLVNDPQTAEKLGQKAAENIEKAALKTDASKRLYELLHGE